MPYAKAKEASESVGRRAGWAEAAFEDTDWSNTWLNEEQNAIRNWQLIGPFANPDNNGFAKAYPPEQEFQAAAQYDSLNGQVSWQTYNGNEPNLLLNDRQIIVETEGGSSSESGYIVKFNPVLLTEGEPWVVSYAHTYLYSPRSQHATLLVAADKWAAVWFNQKQVYAQLRTLFWYEITDSWADRVPVDLHEGWNEVLVKLGKGRGTASGCYGFSFRVADDKGATLKNVVARTSSGEPPKSLAMDDELEWYRISVPPGCVGIVPPLFHGRYRMLLNGNELKPNGERPIDIAGRLKGDKNTLVILAAKDDPLVSPVEFVTGATPCSLKPWTQTGLANFSGTAVYSSTFQLPASYVGKRMMMDLGRVSSVADVHINGKSAGTLVWSPYRLDISQLVQPGQNQVTIAITDAEANRRAVGTSHHILSAIDKRGLEGPVQVIPYTDEILALHPVEQKRQM